MGVYKAEYIWMDGAEPTQKLRCKTKIVPDGELPPTWGFDGSSTNQAAGHASDCVLKPVYICPDPVRGGNDKLVMCEVLLTDMTPHPTNTRAKLVEASEKHKAHEMWFGIEQEYTFLRESDRLAGRTTAFRPRNSATTAALDPMKSLAATSSRSIWTLACARV